MKSRWNKISLIIIFLALFFITPTQSLIQATDNSDSTDADTTLESENTDPAEESNPALLFSEMLLASELSDTSAQAVEDYQTLLSQITLRDLASSDLIGTTVEEFNDLELTAEGTYYEAENGISYLVFNYGEAPSAELLAIFADNHLAYLGVMNLELHFGSEPPSDDSIAKAVTVGTRIDEFEALSPMLSGIGQMLNDGEFITSNFLHTGSSFTSLTGNIVLFDESNVIYSVRAPFQNILGNAQFLMYNASHIFVRSADISDFESSIEAY